MIVVADTGPINYLILIGRIDVLAALYQSVAIPRAVYAELVRPEASDAVREWAASPRFWLAVRSVSQLYPGTESLDPGEREAIALAAEIAAVEIVIDDLRGRRFAKRQGMTVTGTLGVWLKAADNGLLDLDEASIACEPHRSMRRRPC